MFVRACVHACRQQADSCGLVGRQKDGGGVGFPAQDSGALFLEESHFCVVFLITNTQTHKKRPPDNTIKIGELIF